MTKEQILDRIPHGQQCLLIDRAVILSPVRVRAAFDCTGQEFFFSGHYPDEKILPGHIIVEAMGQTGALLACDTQVRSGDQQAHSGDDRLAHSGDRQAHSGNTQVRSSDTQVRSGNDRPPFKKKKGYLVTIEKMRFKRKMIPPFRAFIDVCSGEERMNLVWLHCRLETETGITAAEGTIVIRLE